MSGVTLNRTCATWSASRTRAILNASENRGNASGSVIRVIWNPTRVSLSGTPSGVIWNGTLTRATLNETLTCVIESLIRVISRASVTRVNASGGTWTGTLSGVILNQIHASGSESGIHVI